MPLSPLRILSNNRNILREAILAASSVEAVENSVRALDAQRTGTAAVSLIGAYTGDDEAVIDIEIVDDTPESRLASAPVQSGVGTGEIADISVTGLEAQTITVECREAGSPAVAATLSFEGVKLVAVETGDTAIHVNVDQSAIAYAATIYSLLVPLRAGEGAATTGISGTAGAGLDFDTAVLANNIIPAGAHRIAFADDRAAIYLAYKEFVNREWVYHFVPAIQHDVAAGTAVLFVSGGRTVTITDSTSSPVPAPEVYTDIETVYDLLSRVKAESGIVTVDGVVKNDRSPTGQAARELLVRTDAHAGQSSGTGSAYATGFASVLVNEDASTELITAKCYATTVRDHPLASLGRERWEVVGSLSGKLADAVTGVPYLGPTFGFVIPEKLPPGIGTPRGRFTVTGYSYAPREAGESEPPICPVALTLGAAAVDQTITLTYAPRPSGNCNCSDMEVPVLSQSCLGINGGSEDGTMSYSPDNRERLKDLFAWFADIVRANSNHGTGSGDYDQAALIAKPITRHASSVVDDYGVIQADLSLSAVAVNADTGFTFAQTGTTSLRAPAHDTLGIDMSAAPALVTPTFLARNRASYVPFDTEPLIDMVRRFEGTLAEIDALEAGSESPDPKTDAEEAWDAAVAELKSDVEDQLNPPETSYSIFTNEVADPEAGLSVESSEDLADGDVVLVYKAPGTIDDLLVRKWVPGVPGAIGFVSEVVTAPATTMVKFAGTNVGPISADVSLTPGHSVAPASVDGQAGWYRDSTVPDATPAIGTAISIYQVYHDVALSGLTVGSGGFANRIAILADRYRTRLEWVSMSGGISHLPKSSASILQSGDGCWRDFGDAMWWEVQGSEGGNYAPLFTNRDYISSKHAANGRFYSTREFGLRLNIKCPGLLKAGDKVFLTISDSGWGSTYAIGDALLLGLIAKRDLYLTGGSAGDPTQQWFVNLSADGPFPVYLLNPDAPFAYSSGGLSFVILKGGIAFAKGDRFEFAIVGGHWKWRVNGGAWQSESPPNEITDEEQLFYEGLSVLFSAGAAPCFVAGDRYSFRVWQPWSSSNVRSPRIEMWKWGGSDSAVMIWDVGSVQAIESVALGAHEIPEGATIRLEGGDDPDTWLWSEELTWREGVIYAELAERSARYLRLTLEDAVGGALGWVFAGPALTVSLQSEGSFAPAYKVNRADSGLFQGGRFLGKTIDGEISWTEGALSEEDVSNITDTLDWTKEHDDEQLIVVPNVTRPHEAFLGRIDADRVEFPDLFTWGPNEGKARRHSARLPFAGAWR